MVCAVIKNIMKTIINTLKKQAHQMLIIITTHSEVFCLLPSKKRPAFMIMNFHVCLPYKIKTWNVNINIDIAFMHLAQTLLSKGSYIIFKVHIYI